MWLAVGVTGACAPKLDPGAEGFGSAGSDSESGDDTSGSSGSSDGADDAPPPATTAPAPTTDPTTSSDDDGTAGGPIFDLGIIPDAGLGGPKDCDLDAVPDTLGFTFEHQFDTGFTDATLQASYYNVDDDEVMIMSYYGQARRFALDGTPIGPVFDVPAAAMPQLDGATYDPVERVGLLINQGCVLTTVEPTTLDVISTQQLGHGMSICSGLAIGLDGNMYIASYGTDEMVSISRDGLTEVARVPTLPGIDGIGIIAGSANFLIMSTNPLPAQAAIVDPQGNYVVSPTTLGQAFAPLIGGNPASVDAVLTLCGNGHAWVCDEYGATCLDYAPDDGDKNACSCLLQPQG